MDSARLSLTRLGCCLALLAQAPLAAAQDAEEGLPSTAAESPVQPDETPSIVTRFELEIEQNALVEAGDYAAAAALVDDLIARTEEEFGPESAMLADAHLQAAIIMSRNGDYMEAEAHALDAIEIYRASEGPYAKEMIEPYVVLGDNYQANEDYISALSAYSEARTLSRRVYGLLNPGQIQIIDRMSTSASQLGEFEEAQELQFEALRLISRSYEPQAPEAIDATFKYAAWLRRNNRFTAEREQYMRLDRIISDSYGPDSIELVRVLRERANSYRLQGSPDNLGINGLRDALEIVENTPDADPLVAAEVLRDFGDWETAFSRVPTDGSSYKRAWQLLEHVENADALREDWFERTHAVLMAPLSQRSLSSDPTAPKGNVVVHFSVDTAGRPHDVAVVESNPPGLKDEAVARQVRQSRFRPRIVDGELVPARRAFDIQFRYVPTEDD